MIRKAIVSDLPELRRVYAAAKAYMDAHGNPTQWTNGYPVEALLREDIARGQLYVLEDSTLYAAFALTCEAEPAYAQIDGPGWRDETPYGTIHRIGSDGSHSGVFREAVAFARSLYPHLRVDTHADNRTMQHVIQEYGFVYCGIVDYGEAGLRLAYEWNRSGANLPRVSVITGGANGIGRCIAKAFAARGDLLCVIDRDEARLRTLADELGAFVYSGDIAEKEALDRFIAEITARFGRVDVIVNNACLSRGGLRSCSWEDFNYVLRVGVSAPFYLVQRCLPLLTARAAIVNIASTRAFMSQADTESYTAAKGGIAALTHGLSATLAGKARVNSISPGWIEVGAWQGDPGFTAEYDRGDTAQHPAGRVGRPEDIAEAALFLTSDKNGFITGENLTVDGGMTRLMIYHNDCGWTYAPENDA